MCVDHHKKMVLEKEHYVEVLKYYEIMELLSNARYSKIILNAGISQGLLNLSQILNVGKDVSKIVSNIRAPVDEIGLVF